MDELFKKLKTIVYELNIDSNIRGAVISRFLLGGFTKESIIKLRNCSVQLTNGVINLVHQLIKLAIDNSDYDDETKLLLQRAIFYLSQPNLRKYVNNSASLKKYCQFFAPSLKEKFTDEEVESIAYCNPIFFIEELSEVFGDIDVGNIVYEKICDTGCSAEPNYDAIYKKIVTKKVNQISSLLTPDVISAVTSNPITSDILSTVNNITPDANGLKLIIDIVLPDSFRNLYRLYFGFTRDKKPRVLDEIKDALGYESIEEVKGAMSIAYNIIKILLLTSNLLPKVQTYIQANFKYVEFTATQEKVNDYIDCIKKNLLSGNFVFDDNFKSVFLTHLDKLLESGALEQGVYDFIRGILDNRETMVDEGSEILIELFIRAYRYYLHKSDIAYSQYMRSVVERSKNGFGSL